MPSEGRVGAILGKVQVECGYKLHRGCGGISKALTWDVPVHSGLTLAADAVRWRANKRKSYGRRNKRRQRSLFTLLIANVRKVP